jgi:hypothetical protein
MWVWVWSNISCSDWQVGVVMNFKNLKPDVEFDEYLQPKVYSSDLFLKRIAPLVVGFTCFCLGLSGTMYGFHIWPHSPLFYVIGFLSSILMSIVMLFVGLFVLLITASSHVLKNLAGLYCITSYQVLCGVIFGLMLAYFGYRIVRKSEISIVTLQTIVICCMVVFFLLLITGYLIEWTKGFIDIASQLMTKTK